MMGQKYAAYNAQGAITGYYDSVDSPVPDGVTAIEITDAAWQACIAAQSPYTVENGTLVAPVEPTGEELLADAQATQISALYAAYNTAIAGGVTYTSKGGIAKAYQSDTGSINDVLQMQAAFQAAGAMPAGFYWVATDNTQVPFTYADVQGLANAMGLLGVSSFAQLQTLKAQVKAATTVAAVQAIVWG